MSDEGHRAKVERFFECFNRRDFEIYTLLRVTGSGDQYTCEQLEHYPKGETWHSVEIVEFRGDKVAKVTSYFAAPFPAAEWRSQWVETMEEPPSLTQG